MNERGTARPASDRPLLIVSLRLCRLHVKYLRLAQGSNGIRLMLGTRNWLRPGEYVWRVSVKHLHPTTGREVQYKVWRSAWRRVLPYVGMEPAPFAWEYRPKPRKK